MAPELVGALGFLLLILLLLAGVPVAFSMTGVAVLGLLIMEGRASTFGFFVNGGFRFATSFDLTALPLFLLMGFFAYYSGLVSSAYDAARIWMGRLPGGLAMATCLASGMIGATMGSGASATAAVTRIAVPEMLRRGYDKRLATGTVAAATTVAVLIPPSILMVVYATFVGESLGRMLLAGYLPGILSVLIYMIMIGVRARLNPTIGPASTERNSFRQKVGALRQVWGVLLLFATLLGGIYSGLFTATETAALGALTALVLLTVTGRFSRKCVSEAATETLKIAGMMFLLLIGASMFTLFVTLSEIPQAVSQAIVAANLGPTLFMLVVMLVLMILGCFMDALSMLLIVLPIIQPVLVEYHIDMIWFGIIFIKTAELGAITPPFGIGLYVVKAVLGKAVSIGDIIRGIGWFAVMDVVTIAILLALPQISLWLPDTIRGGG